MRGTSRVWALNPYPLAAGTENEVFRQRYLEAVCFSLMHCLRVRPLFSASCRYASPVSFGIHSQYSSLIPLEQTFRLDKFAMAFISYFRATNSAHLWRVRSLRWASITNFSENDPASQRKGIPAARAPLHISRFEVVSVTGSSMVPVLVPVMVPFITPEKSPPVAFVKFAPLISAPSKFAPFKSEFCRSTPLRLAPAKFAPSRWANRSWAF